MILFENKATAVMPDLMFLVHFDGLLSPSLMTTIFYTEMTILFWIILIQTFYYLYKASAVMLDLKINRHIDDVDDDFMFFHTKIMIFVLNNFDTSIL